MRGMEGRIGAAALLVFGFAMVASSSAVPAEDEPARPRAVHADAQAVIDDVLRATRAFMAEDPSAARAALDGLKEHSPPLLRERDGAYGHEILGFDQAFHLTIDRSREHALAGRMEDSFNQFVWVQRACITCHGMAREKGFLPPRAPDSGPSD